MGDRCNVDLTCRRCDMPVFEKIGFAASYDLTTDHPVVDMNGEELSYGAEGSLMQIAEDGIPFYGDHDAGYSYGAAAFAAQGGRFATVPALKGIPAAEIDKTGTPADPNAVESILEYYALYAKAKAEIAEALTPA